MNEIAKDAWNAGDAYEQYMGRWSRRVAKEFLQWLSPSPGAAWADVGCGTGALTGTILAHHAPRSIASIDRSAGFISHASQSISDPRVQFQTGDATALPWDSGQFDMAVSGLVLNFVPDHQAMVSEMARVTRPSGTVALYVWNYGAGMEMIQQFWDAALSINPQDAKLNQAERFPVCQPEPLRSLLVNAGLQSVSVRAIEIPMRFRDFEDYWTPFLGGTGPAPTYLASLPDESRDQIRETLKQRLHPQPDGSIQLGARVWAVQGTV